MDEHEERELQALNANLERHVAARTHELTSFLVDVMGVTAVPARFDGAVT